MANFTFTYKGREVGSGRKMSIHGTGSDAAKARAEADAKLAMTVMTVEHAYASSEVTAGLGTAAAGTYTDAVIVLQKAGLPNKTVQLENVTTAIFDSTTGRIPGGAALPALVSDFAAAYCDTQGNTGYSFLLGYAVK